MLNYRLRIAESVVYRGENGFRRESQTGRQYYRLEMILFCPSLLD